MFSEFSTNIISYIASCNFAKRFNALQILKKNKNTISATIRMMSYEIDTFEIDINFIYKNIFVCPIIDWDFFHFNGPYCNITNPFDFSFAISFNNENFVVIYKNNFQIIIHYYKDLLYTYL